MILISFKSKMHKPCLIRNSSNSSSCDGLSAECHSVDNLSASIRSHKALVVGDHTSWADISNDFLWLALFVVSSWFEDRLWFFRFSFWLWRASSSTASRISLCGRQNKVQRDEGWVRFNRVWCHAFTGLTNKLYFEIKEKNNFFE